MSLDHDKFIKIMMLTTSPADGEALVAIRKANAMLAAIKKNWEEILKSKGFDRPTEPPNWEEGFRKQYTNRYTRRYAYDMHDDDIEKARLMLAACMQHVKGSARSFIESLNTAFEEHGSLTEKQFAALKKFYKNIRT